MVNVIKSYYHVVVYVVFSGFIFLLVYNQRILRKNGKYHKDKLQDCESYMGIASSQHLVAIHAGGRKLTNNLASLSEKGLSVAGLIDGKQKLFFYFSESDCGDCVENEFENLKQTAIDIGVENIIVFMKSSDPTLAGKYKKIHDLPFEVIGLSPEEHLFEGYVPDGAVMFLVDSDLRAYCALFPHVSIPGESAKYHQMIRMQFPNPKYQFVE